jgi:uncharacterized protein involved in tolerance to divalent cations
METTDELCDAATRRLQALHPYSVPKIVVLSADPEAHEDRAAPGYAYARWLADVVRHVE